MNIFIVTNKDNFDNKDNNNNTDNNNNESSSESHISEQDLLKILEEYFSVNCANQIIENIKQSLHSKSSHQKSVHITHSDVAHGDVIRSDVNSQIDTWLSSVYGHGYKYLYNKKQQKHNCSYDFDCDGWDSIYFKDSNNGNIKLNVSINIKDLSSINQSLLSELSSDLSSDTLYLPNDKNKLQNPKMIQWSQMINILYSPFGNYDLSNNPLFPKILNLLIKICPLTNTVTLPLQTNITNVNSNLTNISNITNIGNTINFNKVDNGNCCQSTTSSQSCLSVINAIELYCSKNNVKQRTLEVYSNSFKQVISYYLHHSNSLESDTPCCDVSCYDTSCRDTGCCISSSRLGNNCFSCSLTSLPSQSWQNYPINGMSLSMFTKYQGSSQNTRFQYFKNIYTILRWLTTFGYIKHHALDALEQYIKTITSQPQIMRPALFCENWLNLNEATVEMSKFLTYLKLNKQAYYSWIFLLISGTRLQETWRYIKCVYKCTDDKHLNKTLLKETHNETTNSKCHAFIETKTTKNGQNADFRIPINNLIKHVTIQYPLNQVPSHPYPRKQL